MIDLGAGFHPLWKPAFRICTFVALILAVRGPAVADPVSTAPASREDLRRAQSDLDTAKLRSVRWDPVATADLRGVMDEIARLLARAEEPGESVPAVTLSQWVARLRELSHDPCDGDAGRAYMHRDMGDVRRALELFERLSRRTCYDPTIVRDASRYVAAHPKVTSPSPVAPLVRPAPAASPSAPAVPVVAPPAVRSPERTVAAMTLNLWQSAWGDFSDLSELFAYTRRNGITGLNVNPGRAVLSTTSAQAYRELQPIVQRLRAAGIREINYLYAELSHPIAGYAAFLRAHPDLGITTIVDDSEFTAVSQARFAENARDVKAAGLLYSAFITLEPAGNSSVTDEMRLWAVEHVDEPIFMSYFGCNLDDQKKAITPYLSHADAIGRRSAVKIALLLGAKSVGRERSCEQELGAAEFRRFVSALDSWAAGYASYGGLVFETNLRLPRYDVRADD